MSDHFTTLRSKGLNVGKRGGDSETLEMAIKNYILIEKSFLGELVFGHPYCSSSNSIEFNAEHETTYPFPCHIGSSIPIFRDMYLHVIMQKQISVIFLYKIHHICILNI